MLVAVEGMVRGGKRVGCTHTQESAEAPISKSSRCDIQNVLAKFQRRTQLKTAVKGGGVLRGRDDESAAKFWRRVRGWYYLRVIRKEINISPLCDAPRPDVECKKPIKRTNQEIARSSSHIKL